jgi:endonuclease/exonuclease/phosphatase family metal-dependent hydrolase
MIRVTVPFRVATYNVHALVGTDGRHDPSRVSNVIDEIGADVLALQEFAYPEDTELETREPVVLTRMEHYQCALAPTRRGDRGWFGNALLTRHPIVDVHRIDLSIDRREPRGALAATIDIRGDSWHVLAAHLGLRLHERRFQVRQILKYLDSVRNTLLVVLGDFNDWLPGRSVVHLLDRRLGRPPRPASFPVFRPMFPLDRIWVQPARALRHLYTHDTPTSRVASDHYPVVADLDRSLDDRAEQTSDTGSHNHRQRAPEHHTNGAGHRGRATRLRGRATKKAKKHE